MSCTAARLAGGDLFQVTDAATENAPTPTHRGLPRFQFFLVIVYD